MCGIAGMFSLDGSAGLRDSIQRMTDIMEHRGPDDSGTLVDGPFALGFRRLSILDLEPTGHQPMTSLDGSCTIIFNGEIYNYVELREKLIAKGYRFRSTGDTEVLLNAYCEWGEECLSMLNGMWAFLIYDRRRRILFGSRDRFGIKPMFIYRDSRTVLFASEIKCIRASGLYRTEINWPVAADFFARHMLDHTEDTFFSGIRHIVAGSYFTLSVDGRMDVRRFWSLPDVSEKDQASVIRDYADLFEDSVRLHKRSDVPLGVFLSGGIDSTSIICSLARIRDKELPPGGAAKLKAFSFMDPSFDETTFIADTIRQTSAELERVDYSAQEVWDDLPKVLWYHDEPVHSTTALIGFRLSKTAASHGIKVILNGQGADESAAGYERYFKGYWQSVLSELGFSALWREVSAFSSARPGKRSSLIARIVARRLGAQAYRIGWYNRFRVHRAFDREIGHPWFSRDFLSCLSARHARDVDSIYLDQMLRRSMSVSPLPLYLRIEDRNAMANSVEIRVPFLDYRLVELLFRSPGHFKMNGPYNKYIIRQAMSDRIPNSVSNRHDKMGFPSPADTWMADLERNVRDVLNSRLASEIGIFDIASIRRDFEVHCRDGGAIGQKIFNVLQFLLWYDSIARRPSELPRSHENASPTI